MSSASPYSSLFGASSQASSGTMPSASPFSSLFGASPVSSGTMPSASPFGASPVSSGTMPSASPFSSLFGASPVSSGTMPSASPFGASSPASSGTMSSASPFSFASRPASSVTISSVSPFSFASSPSSSDTLFPTSNETSRSSATQTDVVHQEPTFSLNILVDKERNKVVAAEATSDFVDTLFSFLSLPLGTIVRLVGNKDLSHPAIIGSINNLYQSVENLSPNYMCDDVCKQMLLRPRNPCEAPCSKLVLNVDDTEPTKHFVCDSCFKLSTISNMTCTCGKSMNKTPQNLDSEGNAEAKGGVFVRKNGSMFLVLDDLKIVPSSLLTSLQMLAQLGYTDLSQIEEVTQTIGPQEILNLLKHAVTSSQPLTDTILANDTKKDIPQNQPKPVVITRLPNSESKMDVTVARSKSKSKIVFAEAKADFVDFIFSFLTVPLGSIVKLLGGNCYVGCVDNLYSSVERLEPSWCTNSHPVLLNPGVAQQFGCPNQPLNLPDVEPPEYYYGEGVLGGIRDRYFSPRPVVYATGGVISKSNESISEAKRLTTLDPRSLTKTKIGVVGFVKRSLLFAVEDDLKVRPLSCNSCLSFLKESSLPLDDLEVKVLGIGETEALSLLYASLTSKSTLTTALEDFWNATPETISFTSEYSPTS